MAGDWIKLEHATIDKPEVLQMADSLGTSADDVLGKLIRVWMWFDVQSRDGHAGNVTGVTLMKFIDRLVASQGFAACMKTVGWLNDSGIPNFDRHNGESSKNRALAKDRKAKERSRECHAETVTREEKRREEKKETHTALPDWVPKDAWDSFVEMRKKGGVFTDRAKSLALAELLKLSTAGHDARAIIDTTVLHGWKSFYAPKTAAAKAGLPSYT